MTFGSNQAKCVFQHVLNVQIQINLSICTVQSHHNSLHTVSMNLDAVIVSPDHTV